MSTLSQSQAVTSIPLNKLIPWDGNVRKTNSTEAIGELQSSIAAHGILQSLVVRKTSRGKFAVVAGRRRYLALSALADDGSIAIDAPVPCRVLPGSADAKEISLAENVVRAPMHPADQFEAFRELADSGSTPADIAARFGITEAAVKKRLRLARVSPTVFESYRQGELTLEQVQAFAVSDDHTAQECLFSELTQWNDEPESIRDALTQDDVAGTDKRTRFVTIAAYEEAGGALRRDLFAEGDHGVFLLDSGLLDRLTLEKLQLLAEELKAEGWKWTQAIPEFDYEARGSFQVRRPEPLPLSDDAAAERRQLAEEYQNLFDSLEEGDEETSDRLDAIESRIAELEDTGRAYIPEVLAVAGAIVTIGGDGEAEILRGLIRPEDLPEEETRPDASSREGRPDYSAALVQSLTEIKSAAIGAALSERPDIALASVVHALASGVFRQFHPESSLQISGRATHYRETSLGLDKLETRMSNGRSVFPMRKAICGTGVWPRIRTLFLNSSPSALRRASTRSRRRGTGPRLLVYLTQTGWRGL
jgi:ParB family chromosome partitioning protein